MVTFCKFMQNIDSFGGPAGARTTDHLIKSHVDTKKKLIISYLYVVNDCHKMLIIGVKCDKFVTKSQAPTTPTGYPPISLFRERDNPPKKSMQQCFTRMWGFYLEGCLNVKN